MDNNLLRLSQTSDGLNISNNQKLWMLRCSLDVSEAHVREWAEVLSRVEEMVRLHVSSTPGSKIKDFASKSLEKLSKAGGGTPPDNVITYLPSHAGGVDREIVRLKARNPDLYRQVISRKVPLIEAAKAESPSSCRPLPDASGG
jgi:hypothetical protein